MNLTEFVMSNYELFVLFLIIVYWSLIGIAAILMNHFIMKA
jgi:hypothetical protein